MNKNICVALSNPIRFARVGVVHTYLPIKEKNEVNTWAFIDIVEFFWPDVLLSVPKVAGEELEHYYYFNKSDLKKNRWGILEPEKGIQTPVEEIDVVVVPLLAFDESLHRVGYGKGYYDKFLKTCRKDCLFIGVSFFPPIDKIDDLNENDIALHYVVTPDAIYKKINDSTGESTEIIKRADYSEYFYPRSRLRDKPDLF